jgi:hypothetical protein
MLIPQGPHRTFKKRSTKKGVPRQSSYTLSSREKRRALERRQKKEAQKAPKPTAPSVVPPVEKEQEGGYL